MFDEVVGGLASLAVVVIGMWWSIVGVIIDLGLLALTGRVGALRSLKESR